MSGSSGTDVLSIARSDDPALSATDNQNVSSLFSGVAWDTRTITYSFPTSSEVYGTLPTYGDPAPFNGFEPVTAQQQAEILRALSLISSYTGLAFSEITETADTHAAVRFANSASPPTAYAYYPGAYPQAGDVFFGALGRHPVIGNSDSGQVLLHEIGHALGLKHGHESQTYGAMTVERADIEFSLMNYPNYIGSTEGYQTASTSPQTFMMYDIAALQHMYGANFDRVGHSATYTWSETTGAAFIDGASQGTPADSHIFQTIWTGGATATYDLSNFAQDQVDDMNPGGWMSFSTAQLAHLNAYAPSRTGDIHALGNVYNALPVDGDMRSLVANLVTGAGNDTITGNAADNDIRAGAGNDSVAGAAGDDRLDGGAGMDMLAGGLGKDTFAYAAGYGADTVLDFLQGDGDAIDLSAIAGLGSVSQVLALGIQLLADAVFDFGSGDSLTVKNVEIGSLGAGDFVLAPVESSRIIEQGGATSLVRTVDGWSMPATGGAAGPQLLLEGPPVVAGQFGAWQPFAAEAAETGYVVIWKNQDSGLFCVWNTDANGNYLWTATGAVPGSHPEIASREPLFQQDLNGDDAIGVASGDPALLL